MLFKALKTGFVEKKLESGPLLVSVAAVSCVTSKKRLRGRLVLGQLSVKPKANVSCQLKVWPFAS